MRMRYNAYAVRKRIYTYIYIDPIEPHWDIFRISGDILFYIGICVLLYDYYICDDVRILVMGKLNLETFMTFIVNYQLSSIYFMGTSQAFMFFILVGGFINILGTMFTSKPRKQNRLQQWTNKKITQWKQT